MHKPIKYVEKALSYAAAGAWFVFDKLNRIRQNPSFKPEWSDKPLLKSWQKTKPTGLAARDRLAVPEVRARNPPADLGGQEARLNAPE
jgi:hypothetical protein